MAKLDHMDRKILDLLQRDATQSHQEIAEHVGSSPTSCWRRIKALEEHGVIRGRVALLDPMQMDLKVSVMCNVTLKEHGEKAREALESFVLSRPEVMECYSMSGETDYMLRIVVPDVAAYEHFLMAHVLDHPFVASASSSFALRQVKYTTGLPVTSSTRL